MFFAMCSFRVNFAVFFDVTQVDVRSNNLTDADAAQLFIPIVDKPHFESFSGIPIKQIRENTVTELDLKGSKGKELEACGGIVLAHVLTGHTSVKQLNFSSNDLGPEGGKAIAASIADNSSITSVSNFRMLLLKPCRGRDSHEISVSDCDFCLCT